ncbi:MAG TPA: transcription antitermination factor NusB [Verrucomicrobiae bacterium]|nr:transcription antitermination factor NusB [Verrucomicrobiae bacterium]
MERSLKPPGKRRLARELAVQFLYQFDLSGGTLAEALPLFWQTQPEAKVMERTFAEELVQGVIGKRVEIDEKIAKYTENWDLPRIAAVDRNILRLAMYEMLFRDDIPPVVSINEAVDIAKKFSTRESGAFVNGILDRLKADLTRPSRTATSAQ